MQNVEDTFYDSGLFPSKRTWSFSNRPVEDNTIFFTASIISTLRMIYPQLDDKSQLIADSIMRRAKPIYSKYRSRNGGVTYNFWQTVAPDLPFPNGNRLISNEKLRLPDDFNTSSLIARSLDEKDSSIQKIRNQMVRYSARKDRDNVKLYTLEEYKNLRAYEVWFGKDMPQAFDLGVISNVLLFVFQNDFELNEYDKASIQLIKRMILNDDHLDRPADISFHSNSSALIIYHVARLISLDTYGFFNEIKEKLIKDLSELEVNVTNEMEQVMIQSSLYRLGKTPIQPINYKKLTVDLTNFSFFTVNPFNISKGESIFLPSVTWVCEAYNWTLLLELKSLE
ncbi:MAG: hypothetical protein AAFY41_08745 [Bacteroidota bacterium]